MERNNNLERPADRTKNKRSLKLRMFSTYCRRKEQTTKNTPYGESIVVHKSSTYLHHIFVSVKTLSSLLPPRVLYLIYAEKMVPSSPLYLHKKKKERDLLAGWGRGLRLGQVQCSWPTETKLCLGLTLAQGRRCQGPAAASSIGFENGRSLVVHLASDNPARPNGSPTAGRDRFHLADAPFRLAKDFGGFVRAFGANRMPC